MKRIKGNSLLSSAQEQIKLHIIESSLQPGDILPTEKEFEQELGISRTSIREALRSLEALGIIESRQGIGRFLREFNYDALLETLSFNIQVHPRDFREIIDVRIVLETAYIERVVPLLQSDDIERLYSLIELMETAVVQGGAEQDLIEVHTEFHLKLYERIGNELLCRLIRIFASIQRTLTVMRRYQTSDKKEFVQLHRRVLDAIEQKDVAMTRRRLLEHFKDVAAWSNQHKSGEV